MYCVSCFRTKKEAYQKELLDFFRTLLKDSTCKDPKHLVSDEGIPIDENGIDKDLYETQVPDISESCGICKKTSAAIRQPCVLHSEREIVFQTMF